MKLRHEREPIFSIEERRQAVDLLKKAKHWLAKDKPSPVQSPLICFAMTRAMDTQADHDIEPKVQRLIRCRLGGSPTLRHWLGERGYPVNGDDDATFKLVQETRHRWLDALIEELQPQEKTNEQIASRKKVPHARR